MKKNRSIPYTPYQTSDDSKLTIIIVDGNAATGLFEVV